MLNLALLPPFWQTHVMCSPFFIRLVTTRFVLLYWWTRNSSVTAKNTTVALQRFQSCLAIFTLVIIHTSICRHLFFLFVSTFWASYCRVQYYFHSIIFCLLLYNLSSLWLVQFLSCLFLICQIQ